MVELEVLVVGGAAAAAAFVVWRQRVACRARMAEMARQEAAESSLQITAVDVPPLGRFPTAEDALDLLAPTPPKKTRVKKRTVRKKTPKKRAE